MTGAATTSSLAYTGRENDGTGLYYYRARYYSPSIGRFVSEDPIGLAGGINPYAYAFGNPIGYRDPSGLDPLVAIGAVIGGVSGAIQAANSGGGWTAANALNIASGAVVGAGVGALAGLVPTSSGALWTLVVGAAAGGGGNLASQVTSWGAGAIGQIGSCQPITPFKANYGQAGNQALLGASVALLGFASGMGSALGIVQGGGSAAGALSYGAWMNATTAGAAQITANNFISTSWGGFRP